ncbi:MAG: hypothetical protein IKQ92_14320 [Clostridia bacterium]|nr:hypothetical protein [Clostridia bacterium]
MRAFKTKLEPFGRGWVNCESSDRELRAASGYLLWARETENLKIDPDLGLCYAYMDGAVGCTNYAPVYCDSGELDRLAAAHPEDADDLMFIKEQMLPVLKHQHIPDYFTEEQRLHAADGHLWGGTWTGHSNPKYADFALLGTDFFRKKVEACRLSNPGHDPFYDAMMTTLDAVDVLGARFGELARDMLARGELTDAQRERTQRIARAFDHAPQKPCRDFFEGVVLFSMIFTLDGPSPDSPGYFDQYMIDLWRLTEPALRRETLENLWQFFHSRRIWNLCIGGSDEHWNDRSNELTYEILDVTAKYAYNTPNLTMRVHRNTPETLMRAAYRTIAAGCGLPALYNDEAVCPALERLGIPPCDSHLYVMNGCNQIDIMGKSHMGLEDGEVLLAKAVELALTNGVSVKSGRRLGLETGDPADFESYDAFYAAVLRQLDHLTDIAASMANTAQKIYRETGANPLRSLLIDGCVEKARDYKDGGPLYGHGQILAEGIADAANSLAVVKKLVFGEKRFTMRELSEACAADFEGFEAIPRAAARADLRFGNDSEFVDGIAKELVDHFNRYLLGIQTVRGGWYGGGCSPFNRAAHYGHALGALPDGHRKFAPLIADSIGAVPGTDVNGPTALLNSCLSFDHTLPTSGFILNVKFDRDLFRTKAGEEAFLALAKSYFERRGQQLSVTVVSEEELRDAQAHPEAHRDLIVRVGGYSDYFVNLSRDLQDNVIARTSY